MDATCDRATKIITDFTKNFHFLGEVDWSSMARRLKEQVVTPAASLATQLQSSPEEYRWRWYRTLQKRVQKQRLERYDVIDSSTHCQVSNDKFRGFANADEVGTFVLPIYPVVLRTNKENSNSPHLVRKGWIVVAVESPKVKSEDTRFPKVTPPMHHMQQIKKEPSPSLSVSIQSTPSTTTATGTSTMTEDDKKSVSNKWPWFSID